MNDIITYTSYDKIRKEMWKDYVAGVGIVLIFDEQNEKTLIKIHALTHVRLNIVWLLSFNFAALIIFELIDIFFIVGFV